MSMSILRRITNLFHRSKLDQEIEAELRAHIEMRTADNIAAGMPPEGAPRQAMLRFGSRAAMKERVIAADAQMFLDSLWQDLGYGLRMLRKSPGFAVFVILTLALGIGATTAIFTVVNRVLLEPLPYPHPDRIVVLVQRSGSSSDSSASIPMYAMWRSETRILEEAVAQGGILPINLLGGEHPEQLQAQRVTASFWAMSGYRVAMGRTFTAEEDVPGGPPVAVISHGLWQRRFGSDPHIAGKVLDLDDSAYTVVGVLSPRPLIDAGTAIEVYLPLQLDLNSENQANIYEAYGLLKPGVAVAQADAALKLVTDQFRRRYPNILEPGAVFAAIPVRDMFASGVKQALLLFLGAVGFVLLIACANVANLLLGRQTGRQREMAIRVALGASRGRIIRQILTEGLLLSLVGGAVGLCVGYAGVRALLALSPSQLPWVGQHGQAVTLDWRVLVFALGISVLVGALSGLVPALRASRTDLASTISRAAFSSRDGGSLVRSPGSDLCAMRFLGRSFLQRAAAQESRDMLRAIAESQRGLPELLPVPNRLRASP